MTVVKPSRILAPALLLLAAAAVPASAQPADPELVRLRIEAGRQLGVIRVAERRVYAHRALPSFYESRGFAPAWTDRAERLARLLVAIDGAAADGLDVDDYHRPVLNSLARRHRRGTLDDADRVSLELLATDAILVLASHLLSGRVNPETVDAEWVANRRGRDLGLALVEATDDAFDPVTWLESMRPAQPGYGRLREARLALLAIDRRGGWGVIDEGATLRAGESGARVVQLRRRLAAQYPDRLQDRVSELFDAELESAVQHFQRLHGLDADGAVGRETRAALNVGPAERARQIAINLERWRWLPDDLGERHIRVNAAAFAAEVWEEGRVVRSHRAVVGRHYRQTPAFTGTMTYLVFAPYWHVPPTIAAVDKLPEIKRDPGYVERQRMTHLRCGDQSTGRSGVDRLVGDLGCGIQSPIPAPAGTRTGECSGRREVHVSQPAQRLSARHAVARTLRSHGAVLQLGLCADRPSPGAGRIPSDRWRGVGNGPDSDGRGCRRRAVGPSAATRPGAPPLLDGLRRRRRRAELPPRHLRTGSARAGRPHGRAVGAVILRLATWAGLALLAAVPSLDAQEPVQTFVRPGSDLRPLRRGDLPIAGVDFEAHRAEFRVRVDGRPIPYSVMAIRVLPGQRIAVVAEPGARVPLDAAADRILEYGSGHAQTLGPGQWSWQAPAEPGPTALRVRLADRAVHLNLFVMHPRSALEAGRLLGYRVGSYAQPRAGGAAPARPDGFVAVRPLDHDILLSPHFVVGQFQCKDPGNPRAFLFTPELLIKLEVLLEAVNAEGYPTASLHIMSGYRTPAYNRAIGNTTTLSRHLYGDAADVFVDVDGDGRMDDLNGDGIGDRHDVRILADMVDRLEQQGRVTPGGMSIYRTASHRGPFLHVDARGRRARW